MSRLDRHPSVIRLSSELGLPSTAAPVQAVVEFCRRKIGAWSRQHGPKNLHELEAIACRELRLIFEEVWSDGDLTAIVDKYLAQGEVLFATLRHDFDGDVFATLLERDHVYAQAHDRYVAVLDCRGAKAYRRYFTRWHEIAHLLTLNRQLQLPLHRSTLRDPIEQVMDIVAGEIGFYGPLFGPIVAEYEGRDGMTFGIVDQVRAVACPDASFQATMAACVRLATRPTLFIEAGLGLKRSEQRSLSQGSLFPGGGPEMKLRALTVLHNEVARTGGLVVHQNMRVPEDSLMYFDLVQEGPAEDERFGIEDLSLWTDSRGSRLAPMRVRVQARRVDRRVQALVVGLPQ